ncbi:MULTISPECIES: DASH family cryptochrome [unclassified Tenacibaculum]|uniref:DASH family cryptochrome n=1 Tax=unclassified Tenacibaculum TaxID=2635139 RepID=UPI001F35FFBA|nr:MULTISPECIES: DASH family cryptochrome [unclassified Tenacibaculum]MCF2873160.1 DASH family cryptochrome [Tenacibaculum sp. Cn5-1]MCF2933316.1 DASH family cryptochrome [Tenacibaculum sp. Cn5-34]MCG7510103.1 DASH family cryptochrome [Tenacibaculum sp. Cn5-46]
MQFKKTAIVWFTSNLRVLDNKPLYEACVNYENVIGLYCFNKHDFTETQFGIKKIEKFRAKFLVESVLDLSKNLKNLNIPLFCYFDFPEDIIPQFCSDHNADAIYFQKEFTYEELKVIEIITQKISKKTTLYSYYDQFLFHPENIPFTFKNIPEVFTNFRKKVEKHATIENQLSVTPKKGTNLIKVTSQISSLEALGFKNFEVNPNTAFPYLGGESQATKRLLYYFFESKKISFYKKTRNGLLGTDYSSKFSPWLANGCISAKTIYWEIKKYEQQHGSNQSTYWMIFELIWRDYFKYLSLKHKNKLFKLEGIKQVNYQWKKDDNLIQSWINGKTSNEFVNANMIELKLTGWMSNRGRQNVASYFTKELMLDWRIGATYFESILIDYDVHSNYGNWQYIAGVGNDPRDRKFNTQLQAKRYDSMGKYRRTWLQTNLF